MKTSATLILPLLLLCALPAVGQEAGDADYSRDTLMRIFVAEAPREERPPVIFHVGRVEFTALGTDWNFAYFPFLTPMHGSNPRVSQEMPDPFQLTRTPIATGPRAMRSYRRAMNRELMRIERSEKQRAKIRVTTRASE